MIAESIAMIKGFANQILGKRKRGQIESNVYLTMYERRPERPPQHVAERHVLGALQKEARVKPDCREEILVGI